MTNQRQERDFQTISFKIEGHKQAQKIGGADYFRCKHCKQTGTEYQMYDSKCI